MERYIKLKEKEDKIKEMIDDIENFQAKIKEIKKDINEIDENEQIDVVTKEINELKYIFERKKENIQDLLKKEVLLKKKTKRESENEESEESEESEDDNDNDEEYTPGND